MAAPVPLHRALPESNESVISERPVSASRPENEVQRAAELFERPAQARVPTSTLAEPAGVQTIPDFGTLRQRVQGFIDALQHHLDVENALILDSITTEIGVGD